MEDEETNQTNQLALVNETPVQINPNQIVTLTGKLNADARAFNPITTDVAASENGNLAKTTVNGNEAQLTANQRGTKESPTQRVKHVLTVAPAGQTESTVQWANRTFIPTKLGPNNEDTTNNVNIK